MVVYEEGTQTAMIANSPLQDSLKCRKYEAEGLEEENVIRPACGLTQEAEALEGRQPPKA